MLTRRKQTSHRQSRREAASQRADGCRAETSGPVPRRRRGGQVGRDERAVVQRRRLCDRLPGRAVVRGDERPRAGDNDERDDQCYPGQHPGRGRAGLAEDNPAQRVTGGPHVWASSLIMAAPLSARGDVAMIASVGTAAITTAISAAASHGTWTNTGR